MRIRVANLRNQKPETSDMHIRVANLKSKTQATIGYAHSDCQSQKISAGSHRICAFGLPI